MSKIDQLCDFTKFDSSREDFSHGENGVYCNRNAFTYSLSGQSSNDLNTIFEKKFTIVGAQKEPVTYLFDLTIGYDFLSSAQIKALIRRVDPGAAGKVEYVYNPLACLYDHSCVESEQLGKNELSIDVILPQGTYELIIFDQ